MTAAETHAALTLRAALYGRTGGECIGELIEAADALCGALQTLRTHPTAGGAERIANQLLGMQRAACQTFTVLAREANQ